MYLGRGRRACLHGKPGNTDEQRSLILALIQAPVADAGQLEKVWAEQVFAQNGRYRLAD